MKHVGCQVGVASRYNELERVNAVDTFRNENSVSKRNEGRFILVPGKVPGTGSHGLGR